MFDHDLRLEVDRRIEPEIFMRWPRITIRTAMLAAAIDIDRIHHPDVGTVVLRYDRLRMIVEELSLHDGQLFGDRPPLVIERRVAPRLEPVRNF